MNMTNTKRAKLILAAVALLAAAAPSAFPLPAKAAATTPMPDSIRVALFLDNGKYRVTVPSVTLSSDSGLTAGTRPASATSAAAPWFGGGSVKTIRTSADQYGVLALEAADSSQASALQGKLTKAGYAASTFKRTRSGKTVYQVVAGGYPTKEAAAAALQELGKNADIASLLRSPVLTGPLHLSAGTYATEAEAAARQAALAQAGLNADLAYLDKGDGTASFAVWIGSEADTDRLNQVKQQALQAVPDLSLQQSAATASYLLRRDDVTDGAVPLVHMQFNPNGQKVWIAPVQGKIKVTEKTGRTYRGAMEASLWKGKLALVNELPFEQYLYSVVTAEMGGGWPAEALKAQAVAARSFALKSGNKYEIANVTDSTSDQAYSGSETEDAIRAVDGTRGETLVGSDGKVVMPYFSSNAGGMTAEPTEVWGNPVSYIKPVQSPDEGAAKGRTPWYQASLADGSIGYVNASYLKDTGSRNAAGLSVMEATEDGVNVRTTPSADSGVGTVIGKLNRKDNVTVIRKVEDSNAYRWQRGPFDASGLKDKINALMKDTVTGSLQRLEVYKRGLSGRAIEVRANGKPVAAEGDALRSVFYSLPSTLFEIEETGRYTILGANGATRSVPESPGATAAVGAKQAGSTTLGQYSQGSWVVMGGGGQTRVLTKEAQYVFTGKGNGHGLGMSQWGARGLAEQGYDYKRILQYYYTGVNLAKD